MQRRVDASDAASDAGIGHHYLLPTFRLLDIPVKVHPSFLLIALALGWLNQLTGWRLMAVWVLIVFVSVLVHEFGHALTARSFGASVEVELNGLGGLTRWGVPDGELPPGRRALVSAAGSGAGFALGGLAWVVAQLFGPFDSALVARGLTLLIFVNFFWGILNWLPIRPLDGGHLLISLLAKIAPRNADRVARIVFMITSGIALVLAIRFDLIFIAILAGWMLITEFGIGERRAAPTAIPDFNYDDSGREAEFGHDDLEHEEFAGYDGVELEVEDDLEVELQDDQDDPDGP